MPDFSDHCPVALIVVLGLHPKLEVFGGRLDDLGACVVVELLVNGLVWVHESIGGEGLVEVIGVDARGVFLFFEAGPA